MFGDEITAEQRQRIALAVQVEDESRGLENGLSATAHGGILANHTNSDKD